MSIRSSAPFSSCRFLRRPFGQERLQAGASLVEVIVATLILAFVALGSVEVFANGHMWAGRSGDSQSAVLLAQEALEKTASVPYAQITGWNDARLIGHMAYSIVVTVQNDSPDAGVKTIQSTVTWLNTSGVRSNVTYCTMRHSG